MPLQQKTELGSHRVCAQLLGQSNHYTDHCKLFFFGMNCVHCLGRIMSWNLWGVCEWQWRRCREGNDQTLQHQFDLFSSNEWLYVSPTYYRVVAINWFPVHKWRSSAAKDADGRYSHSSISQSTFTTLPAESNGQYEGTIQMQSLSPWLCSTMP